MLKILTTAYRTEEVREIRTFYKISKLTTLGLGLELYLSCAIIL